MTPDQIATFYDEQSQTLVPAHQVLEETNKKVAQFILAHQKKIVSKIATAVELGRFNVEYEIAYPSSSEILSGLKSNLEAAGYKIRLHQHTHNPVWTISWNPSPTPEE